MKEGYYQRKNVLVVGLAKSGVCVANLLAREGAKVVASDIKKEKELIPNIKKLVKGVRVVAGRQDRETARKLVRGIDLLVVSPGVPPENPVLDEARKSQVPVESEIEVAFNIAYSKANWVRLPSPPIVAVTGTNGKTTTCELIARILETRKNMDVIVAGNIGTPFSEVVKEITPRTVVVLEISSFQLENVNHFHPYIACVLNITPDHLERHPTMADYMRAKGNILKNQTEDDFCILNIEDNRCKNLAKIANSQVVFFSSRRELKEGIFVDRDMIVCRLPKVGESCSDITDIDIKDIKILGRHNLENCLAAISVGKIFGLSNTEIKKAISSFPGIEHRMEPVRELEGRVFINDSKATNVDACLRALEAFPAPIVLIMGGYDKGAPYSPLRKLIEEKVSHLVLLGQSADRIEKELIGFAPIYRVSRMRDAVELAYALSKPGTHILLSPACSSFDMYRDFEERGRDFKRWVRRL